MEKLTKKDLKSPDAFLSGMGQVSEVVYQYRAPILTTIAVLLIAGIVWVAYGLYSSNREEKAQEALFTAEKKLQAIDESYNPTEKDPRNPQKVETPKAVRTGILEQDYKDVIPAIKEVITKYDGTQASVVASLDMTRLYHLYKKYDDEIPLLERAKKYAGHPVTKALVLNQLGLAYEGKDDCKAAVGAWDEISTSQDMAFMQGPALIKSGLCYEKLKQTDKALQSYQKAEALPKDAESSKAAKKYLRLLKKETKSS